MRRDTQIGIILGIVILVIIGVFLSTRTSDLETVLPDLVMSEEGGQKHEIEEIETEEFVTESKKTLSVVNSTDEAPVIEGVVKTAQPEMQPEKALVEVPKDDTSLEGEWKGVAEEIVEEPELTVQSEIIEDAEIARKIPFAGNAVITEKKQQTSSYGVSSNTIYKVRPNDSLIKIARKYYGSDKEWSKIFEANKDSMSDPNALYVGQELLIPDITVEKEEKQVKKKLNNERFVNVNTHTVEAGDTLYRLAEKYYDDPTIWIKIYEANEDTIEDEGSLIEGQILIIPKL